MQLRRLQCQLPDRCRKGRSIFRRHTPAAPRFIRQIPDTAARIDRREIWLSGGHNRIRLARHRILSDPLPQWDQRQIARSVKQWQIGLGLKRKKPDTRQPAPLGGLDQIFATRPLTDDQKQWRLADYCGHFSHCRFQYLRRIENDLDPLRKTKIPRIKNNESVCQPVPCRKVVPPRQRTQSLRIDKIGQHDNLVRCHPLPLQVGPELFRDGKYLSARLVDETLQPLEEGNYPSTTQNSEPNRHLRPDILQIITVWRTLDQAQQPGGDPDRQRRRDREDHVLTPTQQTGNE